MTAGAVVLSIIVQAIKISEDPRYPDHVADLVEIDKLLSNVLDAMGDK